MQSQMTQFRYRIWQLWRALTGRVEAHEEAYVRQILSPAEYRLYIAMPPYDQRHTLDVALLMGRLGVADESLIAMALLHDIGKLSDTGRPLGLGWYGLVVVLRSFPRVRLWVMRWCEPLRRNAHHEQRSVMMAQNGGARPIVVSWLQRLAETPDDPGLRAFRQADDQC
ncbi:MAG: hypothetical protein RLY87_1662 [Chloroflexota bacterium]